MYFFTKNMFLYGTEEKTTSLFGKRYQLDVL